MQEAKEYFRETIVKGKDGFCVKLFSSQQQKQIKKRINLLHDDCEICFFNKFKYRNEVQLVIYTSGHMFISQITNLSFRPMMSLFWILAFWEI